MARKLLLTVERLEDRQLLAASPFGYAWADASNLSLSFVQDGTQASTTSSSLFTALNQNLQTADWQSEILRAYQTWAAVTNINFHVVSDGGQALGTAGSPQRDARFGDLRIAGQDLNSAELAVSTPSNPTAGTWSGDTIFNTHYNFGRGNSTNYYDLYTVMLQEAGHAFGLDNSTDINSVMYETYQTARLGLSSGDIQSIQALYGPRLPDAYEGSNGNESLSTATTLSMASNSSKLIINADLTTLGDVDSYYLKDIGGRNGPMTVKLQTAGISLLAPRLTVYENGTVIGTVSSNASLTSDLQVAIPNPHYWSKYYVQVSSAVATPFGIGAYRLKVYDGTVSNDGSDSSAILSFADNHTDDTINSPTNLGCHPYAPDPAYAYSFHGIIEDTRDVDFYRIKSPSIVSGTPNQMLVMVWSEGGSQLDPTITVYDNNKNLVSADVLSNDLGAYVVQVNNADPQSRYFLKVQASDGSTGNYFIGVHFRQQTIDLDAAKSKMLSSTAQSDQASLVVRQMTMFHFVLAADAASVAGAYINLTVVDANGQSVFSINAQAGSSTSINIYLGPGTYNFRMSLRGQSSSLPTIAFRLRYLRLSDPIGPQPIDPGNPPPPPDGSPRPFDWIF